MLNDAVLSEDFNIYFCYYNVTELEGVQDGYRGVLLGYQKGTERGTKKFLVHTLVLGNAAFIKIYKGSRPLIKSSVHSKPRTVQITIWNGYNTFFQQGHGNWQDSDHMNSSQESEQSPQSSRSSEEIESSQEGERT